MQNFVTTRDSRAPWFIQAHFPYIKELKDVVKRIPGTHWDPDARCWLLPAEIVKDVVTYAERKWKLKWEPRGGTEFRGTRAGVTGLHPPTGLKIYQQQSVNESFGSAGGFIRNEPMGLGKTAETITSLRLRRVSRGLIVCPAIARLTWLKELDKWWPDHPEVEIVTTRKQANEIAWNKEKLVVTSYALLHYLRPELVGRLDAFVCDEIHYLQNEGTRRYEAARVLSSLSRWREGLTGTLFTNNVDAAWGPLSVMFPGIEVGGRDALRFGSRFQYRQRYMKSEHNGYGWNFYDIREETKEELSARLRAVSARVDAATVGKLLPPFSLQTYYYSTGGAKRAAATWATDAFQSGAKYICVLTDLRETARDIGALIGKSSSSRGLLVRTLTGQDPTSKRHKVLDELQSHPRGGFLVATLHSLNTAIDLTFFDAVAFAELPKRVDHLAQSCGRFHRLTGTTSVGILCSEAGSDQARKLHLLVRIQNQVLSADNFSAAIEEATEDLRQGGLTDEEVASNIAAIANRIGEL